MMGFDRNKSLQELDGLDWGEPNFDSVLVEECQRLRRLPLRDFTIENLRVMIGEHIGLEYLVPLALEHLEADPFAEGDFYPGDLLVSVLRAAPRFWHSHPELRHRVALVAERAFALLPAKPEIATKTVTRAVKKALEEFRKSGNPSLR